jgi:hypothetical protein
MQPQPRPPPKAENDEQLALRPESLYKGELGILLLATELEHPQEARMPMFELA